MRILLTNPKETAKYIIAKHPHYSEYLGWMNTPRYNGAYSAYEEFPIALPVAADNSAFVCFDEARYLRFVQKTPDTIVWITAPDVVGDARETLSMFEVWHERLSRLSLAFVGQDGMEDLEVPWDLIECFFIGGTTEWKLSHAARDLAVEAKARGKWLHMGRVNSQKRLRYAYSLKCDSVDGTGYNQYSKRELFPALDYLDRLHNQLTLF